MPSPPAWWKRSGLPQLFSRRTKHVRPYRRVAYFYDHLMRHVNYKRWAMYIIELFGLAEGGRIERVLELACGTGNVLAELAQAGYKVFGLDSSFEMVQQAAERLSKLQGANCKLPLCCGDMKNFAVVSPVDAVICLYDSFNYCLEPEAARELLDNAAAAVRRGGLFIFDVCTEHTCRRNFNNFFERDSFLEISYIRRAHFKPSRKIQVNEFFITDGFSRGPALYERHEQRIYSLQEINAMIDAQQWELAGCFDGMSRRPGSEKSDRVHFVLKRL
ncbi:MAG: methyltransferase domain-containing protein [candidate division KSB1 bacterium]|nr:methyltransferase domain-containing protein [candidate division KSB1 bacterium]MDZ7366012.1 methyltransferase domain-containing protein [candidate division KSB1 bacterium]MDZ7404129.1 methyltransferase domain-containing protein [candidate division KSB1 bacterium]